jgi:cytochrome b6-f complex iron-sulfur subunit
MTPSSKPLSKSSAPASTNTDFSCPLDRRSFLQIIAGGLGVALLSGCAGSTGGASASAAPIAAEAVGDEWKIPGAASLQAGQAIAFEWPSKTPGLVYIPLDGKMRAISAQCTHAGCTVQWQEKGEFDCPCHGSRFDINGKVLLGPATEPLPTFAVRKQGDDVLLLAKK